MPATLQLSVLLASHDPEFLAVAAPALESAGACVQVVLSVEAARDAMLSAKPPDLALLDTELPGIDSSQLPACACREPGGQRVPIVLFADGASEEQMHWIAAGVLDDIIPRDPHAPHWPLRLRMALRNCHRMLELDRLRASAALTAQSDPLTGVLNRGTLLSMLFRETDRVQRMKTPLCLLLFDIDDFGHWNSRVGAEACDDLLCQVAGRATRLLRSYDLLGRVGKDEFLLVLPGCTLADATMLAERLRLDVFAEPFHVPGHAVRLSACFGVSVSDGRSPVVVLREAEIALRKAKEAGAETVQLFGEANMSHVAPVVPLPVAPEDDHPAG